MKSNIILYTSYILCFIFILIICIIIYKYTHEENLKYLNIVKKSNYMAHALGGIEGENYTNSQEALETNYEKV